MNIIIGFNVDKVIFKMGIIDLASQSVLVFFCKILCAKPEKHNIDTEDTEVSVDKYRSHWYWLYRYAALAENINGGYPAGEHCADRHPVRLYITCHSTKESKIFVPYMGSAKALALAFTVVNTWSIQCLKLIGLGQTYLPLGK